MHNRISHNELAQWNHREKSPNKTDDLIDDYFDCLIECDDSHNTCRKVCGDLLRV